MIIKFKNKNPQINKNCFIAPSANLIGNVIIEENCSIWFNAVLRADTNSIRIRKGTNIQDNCTVHVDEGENNIVDIGENVTVGHRAILHGCNIKNNVLIGMGSIILNGVEIGQNTIIGAGSLVTSNKKIPSGVLCMGSPAKVIRSLTDEEIQSIKKSSDEYIFLSKEMKNQI